jgi:hypothetical protein
VFDQTVWPYRKRRAHLTKRSRLWDPWMVGSVMRHWGRQICLCGPKDTVQRRQHQHCVAQSFFLSFLLIKEVATYKPSTIFQVKGKHEKTTLITFVKPILDFTCLFGITSNDLENHRNAVPDSWWCTRDGPVSFRINFDTHVDEITQTRGEPNFSFPAVAAPPPRARSALATKHLNSWSPRKWSSFLQQPQEKWTYTVRRHHATQREKSM